MIMFEGHDPYLVALSVAVAILGGYTGFGLTARIRVTPEGHHRVLLAGAAAFLAIGIWTMHFIGMLAAPLPPDTSYLILPTIVSFLICVLVVGVSLFFVSTGEPTLGRLASSAVLMGVGITSMHYVGMHGLSGPFAMVHRPIFVVFAALIAIGASYGGLRAFLARHDGWQLIVSAIAFGVAVSGMHYTAMAGMTIFPHPNPHILAPALSPDLLAIVVAIVAFVVSGLFLLVLVPDRVDRTKPLQASAAPFVVEEAAIDAPRPSVGAGPTVVAAQPIPADSTRRTANHHLPVERDRATYLMPVEGIVAVRANAHYTTVFDGKASYFCSLPIGDVEARLTDPRFVRVHRSHIINLDRVVALKNSGDNCQIELSSGSESYLVPVSRSRTAWVKAQFGLKSRHHPTA